MIDVGTFNPDNCDYPDFGFKSSQKICSGEAEIAVLLCGTGIGMSISANKLKGIRAAICWNTAVASLARKHNDANVLCLPARFLTVSECIEITDTFLKTSPEIKERYLRRIKKINNVEEGGNYYEKQ